jgi:hypothetical protein
MQPRNPPLVLALARLGSTAAVWLRDYKHAHAVAFGTDLCHGSRFSIAGEDVHIQYARYSRSPPVDGVLISFCRERDI